MNSNLYIFGEFSSGYTQYPEDSSLHIFKKIYPLCKAFTQIIIHRDSSMMYYCYIRKMNFNKYLGLCIAVNGYYIERIDDLFSIFENTIEKIAQQGTFIHFAKDGALTTSTILLKNEEEEIDNLFENLRCNFEELGSSKNKLPHVDYTVAKDSIKEFTAIDDKFDIVRASYTYGYTFIYKNKDYDTVRVNSFQSILNRINNEKDELRRKNQELKRKNSYLVNKQRNTRLVGFLAVIIAILGGILYFKVINPSEVTKYQTGEFIYYGPLKDKKPNGEGVAFYPETDKFGRRYYIGHFEAGERQDSTAMLFYQNGDYYYGSMKGDEWEHGLFYNNTDNSHYIGDFINNTPYDGVWFYHEKAYELKEGKIKK